MESFTTMSMLGLVILVATTLAQTAPMKRVWLNSTTLKPKCIDGSSAAMYIQQNKASTKFIIFLEGGGLCKSENDCIQRSKGNLGSSNGYGAEMTGSAALSPDPAQNPDFHDWNHIYVPYCSGDVWDGTIDIDVNPWNMNSDKDDTWKGFFQGHLVVEGVLNATRDAFGLKGATDVILTGSSAGGVGTFANCDYTATYMAKIAPSPRVVCNPQAGYFGLAIDNYDHFTSKTVDPDPRKDIESNWTIHVEPWFKSSPEGQACIKDVMDGKLVLENCTNQALGTASCCGAPVVLYPYLKTPTFVSENTADSYQVFTQGQCPKEHNLKAEHFVTYLHNILTTSLQAKVKNGAKGYQDGMFAPACLAHGLAWMDPKASVDNRTHQQAFGDWYYLRNNKNMSIDPNPSIIKLLSCSKY